MQGIAAWPPAMWPLSEIRLIGTGSARGARRRPRPTIGIPTYRNANAPRTTGDGRDRGMSLKRCREISVAGADIDKILRRNVATLISLHQNLRRRPERHFSRPLDNRESPWRRRRRAELVLTARRGGWRRNISQLAIAGDRR